MAYDLRQAPGRCNQTVRVDARHVEVVDEDAEFVPSGGP